MAYCTLGTRHADVSTEPSISPRFANDGCVGQGTGLYTSAIANLADSLGRATFDMSRR